MAVSISDGGLVWTASIDDSKLPEDIKRLQKIFEELDIDFINEDTTAASLKKVQESVIQSQKEIFSIQEASNTKLNAELISDAALTQEKITEIVKQEAKIRSNASRDEAQALLNSQLPIQQTGLPVKPAQQTTRIDDILGEDVAKQVREAENLYSQLDQTTKEYVSELVELEIELEKVEDAQKKLNKANKEGKVNADDYRNGTEVLAARHKQIADSLQLVTKRQKDYEAATASDISSINGKKVALKQLVQQYQELSEAEKNSTQGKALAANIRSIANELEKLKRAGTTGFDDMGNAIKRQVGLLEKLKRQSEIYRAGIQQATLPENIAKYNRKLEDTNVQITKLSNAGKKGFDELGNSTAKAAGKAGLLQKGFGFLRQAALFIPGIGLAGIIGLITEGIASLVSQLFKGNNALGIFAANFKNVKDVMAQANKEAGKQITDLKILYSAATNVNLSLKDRKAAVDALQTQFPDYFGNIKDEVILNGQAQKSYDALVLSITAAARAKAVKDKLDLIAAEKLDIEFQKLKIANATAAEAARARDFKQTIGGGGIPGTGSIENIVTKEDQLRTIKARKDKALREQEKKEVSLNEQEKFLIQFVGQKNLTKVVIDENKKREKSVSTKGESELLNLLEKRRKVLDGIAELERDAFQSGLVKEASEIDKINERREKELRIIEDINKAIDKYNAKHKVNIEKLGDAERKRINDAAETLIKNTTYKREAEEYLKATEEKRKAFEEFNKAQETGNTLITEQAREQYQSQLGTFERFVDLLQAEYNQLFDSLSFDGTDDIGQITRFNGIKKLLDAEIKKSQQDQILFSQQQFKKLLDEAETFNQKKFDIAKKYNDLEATLEKEKGRFSPEELKERQDAIRDAREDDLKDLENETVRQSKLYKKLSEDIIKFSRDQIKQQIKDLEKILKADKSLTPQMKADIQGRIDQLKGVLNATNEVAIRFDKLSESLRPFGNIFSSLADSVGELNSELGDTLRQMGDMINVAADAAGSIASFAAGDIAGGISGAVGAINGIISGFAKAAKSAKDAKKAIIDFNKQIISGEAEYQQLLRERQREQVKLNKLRIQGLEDEKKLLEEQRKTALQSYNDIFAKLQEESFISGQHTKKKRGSLLGGLVGFFAGTRTQVKNELESLAGKTFEEMEKLFTSGQLTDSAKALFEQLKKIKEEGVDIDRLLEENKLAAQQLFTGTTSESIADSIIAGLEEGKRSVEDFASDFQSLMQQAFLNSLKFKYLEGPIQSFFEDFAAASESDGQLTSGEIDRLRQMYNNIIENATDQFEQLQQVAGLNFNSGPDARTNTLTGAIKGITETQAELLAGQFGGIRISIIEQNRIAMRGVETLQNIESNTARLIPMYDLWRRLENDGIKVK